jgi:hypothetical protein
VSDYGGEYPRDLPRANPDYDGVLRQWRRPPPQWLWWYRPKPTHNTWDTVAGILGLALLVLAVWGFVAWAL